MIKEKLYLWDYPYAIWGRTNQEQMGGVWKKIGENPPRRILEAALQAILEAYDGDEREKEMKLNIQENISSMPRKSKRGSSKGLGEEKRKKENLISDTLNRDDSRVLTEVWNERA